jgi:hypothetical protein
LPPSRHQQNQASGRLAPFDTPSAGQKPYQNQTQIGPAAAKSLISLQSLIASNSQRQGRMEVAPMCWHRSVTIVQQAWVRATPGKGGFIQDSHHRFPPSLCRAVRGRLEGNGMMF